MGAGIEFKIKTAKEADVRIALDGCKLCCVKRILENAGINDSISIVAQESGIRLIGEKPTEEEIKKFVDYVEKRLTDK